MTVNDEDIHVTGEWGGDVPQEVEGIRKYMLKPLLEQLIHVQYSMLLFSWDTSLKNANMSACLDFQSISNYQRSGDAGSQYFTSAIIA